MAGPESSDGARLGRAVGAVDDVDAERGELLAESVSSGEVTSGSGGGALRDERGGALGERRRSAVVIPDPVEVEPEDHVGVEDEPAPLVGGQVGPEDLADEGEGHGQVEVVVDGGHEPVVEGTARVGQRAPRARGPGRG